MAARTLVPDPAVVTLEELVADAADITVIFRTCRPAACCPECGQLTRRVHSHHSHSTRRLRDLPWPRPRRNGHPPHAVLAVPHAAVSPAGLHHEPVMGDD